ncbi:MAG: hypothetical protein ACYCX2_02325 [Christensenellales bacterium]
MGVTSFARLSPRQGVALLRARECPCGRTAWFHFTIRGGNYKWNPAEKQGGRGYF